MTTTYISMLRGINVGGSKKVKMDDLRQMYESLGLQHVQTYIQSGNVVFQSAETAPVLEQRINEAIAQTFHFDVPVLVKTLAEMEETQHNNPFAKAGKEATALHVTFLSAMPLPENLTKIEEQDFTPDEFIADGTTIYLCCPNGYGRTKLTNTFFESKLKVTATTRNWKTVGELAKLVNNY